MRGRGWSAPPARQVVNHLINQPLSRPEFQFLSLAGSPPCIQLKPDDVQLFLKVCQVFWRYVLPHQVLMSKLHAGKHMGAVMVDVIFNSLCKLFELHSDQLNVKFYRGEFKTNTFGDV